MRNLKKILALVLALVMSLSLMATAGAKDFTDKSDLEATGYQTAVDVLAELEVIRGYADGSFQPNGDITRAEVAAIIYRIATKDVKDTQASIYTSWGKFDDVKDGAWYAGYVNYCANAGIVKGTSATTFQPENKVTGYEVLAMILRTMGYGKNDEFAGGNWAINTAAQAKQIGIIDNILEQKLGSPASRAMVAEILFRAMLTETVDYNALTGYQPNGKTLGQTQFGLEEITGVVMANEYADLEDTEPLSTGKTRLNVDGKNYTLNVTTDLTDIGESRAAYVKKTASGFDLLIDELVDAGNAVAETGEGQSNIKSYAAKSDAALDITGAQHFVNFDYAIVGESEWRIVYQVAFDTLVEYDKDGNALPTAQERFENEYGVDFTEVFYDENGKLRNPKLDSVKTIQETDAKGNPTGVYYKYYTRVIPIGNAITVDDIAIMRGIFSLASDDDNYFVHEVGVKGYVHGGTSKDNDNEQHDLSSEMSWRSFYNEYIVGKTDTTVTYTDNGDWLKIIDNDGDGVAEYVFKTVYCMEQISGKSAKHDYFTFASHLDEDTGKDVKSCIDASKDDINYIDEVDVGDVVLAALIDGVWQVEKAPEEIKVIQTVNYRNETVTTTEGDEYEQSGIDLHHDMDKDILEMGEKVEYTIYFDHFGYVGAYATESAETNYALLTELYYKYDRNGKFLTNTQTVVEITMGEEKTDEKVVTNTAKLAAGAPWFEGIEHQYNKGTWSEYLQRAINHLGLHQTNASTTDPDHRGAEFVYPTETTETNVAVYTFNEDDNTVEIYPAAKYAENRQKEQLFYTPYNADGTLKTGNVNLSEKVNEAEFARRYDLNPANVVKYADLADKWTVLMPVYAVDYVKLDTSKNIGGSQVRYDMDKADASWNQYGLYDEDVNDTKYQGNYVNATHQTEYYVVSRGGSANDPTNSKISGISYYVGYENLPKFAKEDILAMYAVATNTTAALDKADYWVADVIVIEANATVASYDSVALAYYNPVKSTGTTRHLDALDNMTNDPKVDLVPTEKKWDGYWTDSDEYGFYALYNTEVDEPSVAAGKISLIESNFNKYGIHAGYVYRDKSIYTKGDYVMIDRTVDHNGVQEELFVGDVPVYGIVGYKTSTKWEAYDLTTADLATGDHIIYVNNKANNTLKFIVVTNFNGANYDDPDYKNNTWTDDLWYDILVDQQEKDEREEANLYFNLAENQKVIVTCEGQEYPVKSDNDITTEEKLTLKVTDADDFWFTIDKTVVFALKKADNGDYAFQYRDTKDPNVIDVRAYNTSVVKPLSEEEDTTPVVGAAYTAAAVEEIVTKVTQDIKTSAEKTVVETLFGKLFEIQAGAIDEDAKIGEVPVAEAVKTAAVTAAVNVIISESDTLDGLDIEAVTAMVEKVVTAAIEEAITASESKGEVSVDISDVKAAENVTTTVGALEQAVENGDIDENTTPEELEKVVEEIVTPEDPKDPEDPEDPKDPEDPEDPDDPTTEDAVKVTLKANGVAITKLDAGTAATVTPKNGDYTIEADTKVVVTMNVASETTITEGMKVVLTPATADAAKIEVVIDEDTPIDQTGKLVTVSFEIPAGTTETYTVTLESAAAGGGAEE